MLLLWNPQDELCSVDIVLMFVSFSLWDTSNYSLVDNHSLSQMVNELHDVFLPQKMQMKKIFQICKVWAQYRLPDNLGYWYVLSSCTYHERIYITQKIVVHTSICKYALTTMGISRWKCESHESLVSIIFHHWHSYIRICLRQSIRKLNWFHETYKSLIFH